ASGVAHPGQGPQHEAVDDAEHQRIHADAQRQRDDRRDRDARRSPHEPEGVEKILHGLLRREKGRPGFPGAARLYRPSGVRLPAHRKRQLLPFPAASFLMPIVTMPTFSTPAPFAASMTWMIWP